MTLYAKVFMADNLLALDTTFDYIIPEELKEKVESGVRVEVPFGKGNRKKSALVVKVCSSSLYEDNKLKTISSVLDSSVSVPSHLIKTALYMREEFFCSYGEAINAIIPSMDKARTRVYYSFSGLYPEKMSALENDILSFVKNSGELSLTKVASRFCDTSKQELSKTIEKLVKNNALLKTEERFLKKDTTKIKMVRLKEKPRELDDLLSSVPKNAKKQRLLLCELFKQDASVFDLRSLGIDSACLKRLEDENLIEIFDLDDLEEDPGDFVCCENRPNLTQQQQSVVDEFFASCKEETCFLLHGVTGSGKTEVFLRIFEKYVKEGRQCLLLVPEISLTPQMMAIVSERFKGRVAIMHSRLSERQRYENWQNIRSGKAKIILGARSAIFMPFKDLGVIVIDEEHEGSYKSSSSPRYNTIKIAQYLSVVLSARLILSSATPDVSSYYKAKTGQYHLLKMTKRVNEKPLPHVEIVDMKDELLSGNRSPISKRLKEEIEQRHARGEQSILFINRRGYSTYVFCRQCGYIVKCPNCDVSLTYHIHKDTLTCHYCGHKETPPSVCPNCGSKKIKFMGTGTQKIEEYLNETFPGSTVIRMDSDTTRKPGSVEKIFASFLRGEYDILLGTQMVVKGLDFHNVTLVGILLADASLNFPDINAAQRTFQLISQASGRAGRGEKEGTVIMQTYDPKSPVLTLSASQDFESFYAYDILHRQSMGYAPFGEILGFFCANENEAYAVRDAKRIYEYLVKKYSKKQDLKIYNPSPAFIQKLKGKHIYHVLVCYPPESELKKELRTDFDIFKKKAPSSIFAEIDPVTLL